MVEPFEERGYWWLPEKEKNKILGTLTYDPDDGARLDLAGTLRNWSDKDPRHYPAYRYRKYDVILGEFGDGSEITLCDCRARTPAMFMQPHFVQSPNVFDVYFFYRGRHFESSEAVVFDAVYVRYPHLLEWTGTRATRTQWDQNTHRVDITHERPPSIPLDSGEQLKLTVTFGADIQNKRHEASVRETCHLKLAGGASSYLQDYLPVIRGIRDFLTLATMRSGHPMSITGTVRSKDDGDLAPPVSVYDASLMRKSPSRSAHREMMLFTLEHVLATPKAIAVWLRKCKTLRQMLRLYFDTYYYRQRQMAVETRFLSAISAVEAYFNRTRDSQDLPTAEFRCRSERVLGSCPPELHTWVRGKLGNRKTLRQVLRELFEEQRYVWQEAADQLDCLVGAMVRTRNYLAHPSADRPKAYTVPRVVDMSEKLKLLLTVCLLQELGFGEAAISAMAQKLRDYGTSRILSYY